MILKTKELGVTIAHDSDNGLYQIKTSQRINVKLAAILPNKAYNRGNAWYYSINIVSNNADKAISKLLEERSKIKLINSDIKNNVISDNDKKKISITETLVDLCQFMNSSKNWYAAERYNDELRNRFNILLYCN